MGILNLSKLIADVAPGSIRENEMKNYFGRKVAIDASMSLYQFLIAVRSEGSQLTNADGETTSHLMGLFYRTIRMVDAGLKPLYVFDGKPPVMKSGELEKRSERREEAQNLLDKAKEEGNVEEMDKQSRRLVKVSKNHVEEAKSLLKLMGIPFMEAPCEAEAQCAQLVKSNKVFAVGTEDMDALTFGTSVLLRHLTFSEARKMPIKEFHLEKVLQGLDITMDQFVDLCILLGCDYCDKIRGIGPKNAYKLIKEHGDIETIIKRGIDGKKYCVPESFPFDEARRLFKDPEVTPVNEIDFKWTKPDEEGLVSFMCGQKGFAEERIRSGAKKLAKARQGATQGRLDGFFTVKSVTQSPKTDDKKKKGEKRKSDECGKADKKKRVGKK